jgi:hypothetical protein
MMAAPLAVPVASSAGAPFAFDEPDDSPPRAARRRRRGNGGLLVGLGLLAGLLALTGGLAFAFRDKIQKTLSESTQVVDTGEDPEPAIAPRPAPKKEEPKTTAPKNKGPKTTPRPKDGSPRPRDKDKAPPPKKDPPPKKNPPPKKDPPVRPVDDGKAHYPRRALIISVHNYLYANPIMPNARDADAIPALVRALNLSALRLSLDQIYHVSDEARKNSPPLKPVIEQSLTNFLKTSRKQDRLLVFFIGHTRLVDNEAYLVPLEGDFKDASTLIPLKWVFQQLAACPARQKILVLDGNRFSASQGEERPAAGPLDPKFEAALLSPPPGVQVWSACSASQQSLEFAKPLGLFLDSFRRVLLPDHTRGEKGALDGKLPNRNDLIPLKTLHDAVAARMKRILEPRKLTQVPKLAGSAPVSGADYDRTEAAAPAPAFPVFAPGSQEVVKEILNEISLPPVKPGLGASNDIDFAHLPPFSPDALKKYEGTLAADSRLRQAIHKARVALWAVSTASAPVDLQGEVLALREKLKFRDLSVMRPSYTRPSAAAEANFKKQVMADGMAMARIVAQLEDVLEELNEAGAEKAAAPARWQANYTYILARFQAQLTYLEEYQGLLGQMRKEFPPMDEKIHSGWKMAAKEKPSDSAAKKYLKKVREGYKELATKHRGTPWEVLGRREDMTSLGLEWRAY